MWGRKWTDRVWAWWASQVLAALWDIRRDTNRIAIATEAIAKGPPEDRRSVTWKPGTLVEDS